MRLLSSETVSRTWDVGRRPASSPSTSTSSVHNHVNRVPWILCADKERHLEEPRAKPATRTHSMYPPPVYMPRFFARDRGQNNGLRSCTNHLSPFTGHRKSSIRDNAGNHESANASCVPCMLCLKMRPSIFQASVGDLKSIPAMLHVFQNTEGAFRASHFILCFSAFSL